MIFVPAPRASLVELVTVDPAGPKAAQDRDAGVAA
jgi:hypothetical protein